jgi:hypothetical protein
MATTISNPASFSSVRTAFNTEGYGISTSFFAYRQGAGIVPASAYFNAIGAGTGGDPLQLSQFSGFTVPSPATFSPAGGTSPGAPVALSAFGQFNATVTITCSQSCTWTYSPSFGFSGASAGIVSGSSAASITFSMDDLGAGPQNSGTFSVTGVAASGTTRYWTGELETFGNA